MAYPTPTELCKPDSYPRPQFRRKTWASLNGVWEFAFDSEAHWTRPDDVAWNAKIRVPFSPETPASGIGDRAFYRACWYRRTFDAPRLDPGSRLILHFGAVDYATTVWVNGRIVVRHEGGFTPIHADITDIVHQHDPQALVLRAEDDPQDLTKPRGKQDWKREPHSIWYPRTTGIWQTVWWEVVPAVSIASLRFIPALEHWEIGFEAHVAGECDRNLRLGIQLHEGDKLLADDVYTVVAGEVHRRIALSDPGIDDFRNELVWSPERPILIAADLQLFGCQGQILDEVESYTALRGIGVQGDRFVLNGRPYPLRMVLDQGYWPETGLTAPDDTALRRDVELVKAMGFNGVRKHQKIEDPRYLYWADRLGLLVWEEMPSAYRFTTRSVARLAREWIEVIDRDISHPCIVAWVPFNESWGVPDLPDSSAQRHYVQALYHLTKTLDPTRPVIGNDGWESVATDIIGIHDYDDDPDRIAHRYGTVEMLPRLFERERPGGRVLLLDGHPHRGQPIMLTEFGGIAYAPDPNGTWGYTRARSAEGLAERYMKLLRTVRSLPMLTGFCYTQFADTYQEANGLLYADRTPKFPIEVIALATRGAAGACDEEAEALWRERLIEFQRQHAPDPQAQQPGSDR